MACFLVAPGVVGVRASALRLHPLGAHDSLADNYRPVPSVGRCHSCLTNNGSRLCFRVDRGFALEPRASLKKSFVSPSLNPFQ